jgi:tetratricopeptide (TPR) repeat protein
MLIGHFRDNPGQFGDEVRTADEQSKELARHALSIDPCTVDALFIIAPLADDTDPMDQVYQTGPSWTEIYNQRMELIERAIECEPQNATAWLQMMFFHTFFPLWPNTGTEYPAEQARAALNKAYRLDPTNCWLAGIRITMLRSEFWAPRPEDVMSRDELKDTLRAALLVDPTCGFMYDILEAVNVSEARLDEAIAWKMLYHELAPQDPRIGCRIAELFLELGLVEQAREWAARTDWPGCLTEADIDCRQSRESYYSESCQADRIKQARDAIESDFASFNRRMLPFKYREALYLVGDTDRLDLARKWLEEGLQVMETDDPVALLNKNPKRLNTGRNEGLSLVPVFRDLGLADAANRQLELCRRDPSDPAQITFDEMKGQYLDARHRSLAGHKEEAMTLLTRAVREHQTWSLILDWPSPDRSDLMFDRALDPLREDPVYAPQLEQLLEEYDAWLAPARERAARAAETGDWASLRMFIDTPPEALTRSE